MPLPWRKHALASLRARSRRRAETGPPALSIAGWTADVTSAAVRGGATTRTNLHVEVDGLELADAVRRVTSLAALERGFTGAMRETLRCGTAELHEQLGSPEWAWEATVERPQTPSRVLSTPWPHEPERDELAITWSGGWAEVRATSWSFLPDMSQRVTISARRVIVPDRGTLGELSALMRALLEEPDADLRVTYHDACLALTNSGAIRTPGARSEHAGVLPSREAVFQLGDRRVVVTVTAEPVRLQDPPTSRT